MSAANGGGVAGVSDYDKDIDSEIVETWQRFVQAVLGILVLTGGALLALYFHR
jgi:hypothetical protein